MYFWKRLDLAQATKFFSFYNNFQTIWFDCKTSTIICKIFCIVVIICAGLVYIKSYILFILQKRNLTHLIMSGIRFCGKGLMMWLSEIKTLFCTIYSIIYPFLCRLTRFIVVWVIFVDNILPVYCSYTI